LAGFAGYREGTNGRAWLLTIVRRGYLNGRPPDHPPPAVISFHEPAAGGVVQEPIALHNPRPEEEAVRRVAAAPLRILLAGLPEPFRAAVLMVDVAGLRYAEAASVLRCPLGTVMSRLHRGRKLLAQQLNPSATHASGLRDGPHAPHRDPSLR